MVLQKPRDRPAPPLLEVDAQAHLEGQPRVGDGDLLALADEVVQRPGQIGRSGLLERGRSSEVERAGRRRH